MITRILAASVAALSAAAAVAQPAQPAPPAPPADWSAAARQDVLGAYQLYVDNHPGMHDPANPGFPRQLERARDAGLAIAATATGAAGHANALGAFSAELSDGHAQAMATQAVSSAATAKRVWPGFIAAWRGKLLVHHAEADAPAPKGSQILRCDGLAATDFVRRQIGYRGFRPKEAGHWWYRPTQAFYGVEGLWDGPRNCTFRLPDGSERQADLSYRPAPSNFPDLLAAATDGERTPIGLTEPRPGLFLIGMPDFSPKEDGVKAYRTLFDTLERRRSELLKAKAVVIDLRHNNGGSSAWSRQGARLLWGTRPVEQKMGDYFKDVRIWWRASPDNSTYVAGLEQKIRKDGNTDVADSFRDTAGAMKAALAKGEPYFVEGLDKAERSKSVATAHSDFKTPVYVITPGRCASACNDALDAFTRFGNVKLIGAPASGDSTYMEVRLQDLPSGHGRIVIPNKMWVGRPRGSGEVYGPHILVEDLDWSTATFLDHVERDLASR